MAFNTAARIMNAVTREAFDGMGVILEETQSGWEKLLAEISLRRLRVARFSNFIDKGYDASAVIREAMVLAEYARANNIEPVERMLRRKIGTEHG